MRISNLETFVPGTAWRTLVFLRLTNDDGPTGAGEASPTNLQAAPHGA